MRAPKMAVLLAVVVGACAGPGATAPTVDPSPSPSATLRTADPSPSSRSTPDPAPGSGPAGERFRDPGGDYEMTVGEDWVANHDTVIDGVELWFVGPQEAGFTPNVNVITQGIGTMTFEEYAELSVNSGPTVLPDFKLVTSGEAVGPGGSRLGVMEFTGTTNAGANALHFLAIWSIRDGQAIVATLTSPQDSFARLRAEVEPYMLTLRAI